MAKNEEKAHALLNRYVSLKKEMKSRSKEKRPLYSWEVSNLQECDRWRNQIIKDLTKKITAIQNPQIGELRIRTLNDEINKLLREKAHWEDRIKELGGPDWKKLNPKAFDAEGFQLPGSEYSYWGAAKDLPGVRDLYAKDKPNAPKRARVELYKHADYEYFYDEIDSNEELLEIERQIEEKRREGLVDKSKDQVGSEEDREVLRFRELHMPIDLNSTIGITECIDSEKRKELEAIVLERKKDQIIKRFGLDSIQFST